MTEKVRRHIRRGINISGLVAGVGSLLALMQMVVAMRGQLIDQEAKAQTTASAMAAMMKDVGGMAAKIDKVEMRVSRLERPPRNVHAGVGRGTLPPDTVAVRSPGVLKSAGVVLSTSAKALWGGVRSLFGGG